MTNKRPDSVDAVIETMGLCAQNCGNVGGNCKYFMQLYPIQKEGETRVEVKRCKNYVEAVRIE